MSDHKVEVLYRHILDAWNADDAHAFAAPFADDGRVVGFDGSQVDGRAAIEKEMGSILADHKTGTYVGIVRSVREVGSDAAVLHAVAGIVPAGQDDINPDVNSIQGLVAERRNDGWQVVLYQNTSAQFHGRPELVEELTDELRTEFVSAKK
jgi:uncharacterized protein (TIGR02246 family)